MSGDLRVVWDVTGINLPKITIPAGVGVALYTTGSNGVPATRGQLAAHPDAVQFDQSPVNTLLDEQADEIDMESGAATLADLPGWWRAATDNYLKVVRPGQRVPMTYASASRMGDVVGAYTAAGIASGPRLHVAHWDLPIEQAIDLLVTGGPFPGFRVDAVQIHNAGLYDVNLYRTDWLDTRAHIPAPAPAPQYLYAIKTVPVFDKLTSTDGGHTYHA